MTLALDPTRLDVHDFLLGVRRPFGSLERGGLVQLEGYFSARRPSSGEVQRLLEVRLVDHRDGMVEETNASHDPGAVVHHSHQGSCEGWQVDIGDVVIVLLLGVNSDVIQVLLDTLERYQDATEILHKKKGQTSQTKVLKNQPEDPEDEHERLRWLPAVLCVFWPSSRLGTPLAQLGLGGCDAPS